MKITSDAINERGDFDPRYTCDMDNSSPEIRWDDPPDGAVGFALVMEDLDSSVPGFSHWVVYHVPGNLRHLPAGIPPQDTLPNGIRQGLNTSGKLGYLGPCPPHGSHRYRIRLFALRVFPEVAHRASKESLLAAIAPFTIEEAWVEGHYRRLMERAG